MSLFVNTSRILRNSLQHIQRNMWHAVTAILVMILTIFIASLLGLILYSSNRILTHLENKLEVTAFFKESTSEEYIAGLQQEIEQTGLAEEVRYISQEQALEIYRQQNIDDPDLLEFVTADILPASLSISAKELDDLGLLAARLAEDEKVERVIYQEDVVGAFKVWSERIRLIGITLSGFLIAVSVLILLIVVSLNISDFGKEIEIMRLVGASNWYIRWPFLLDGVIFGLISAFLSTTMIYLIIPYFEKFVGQLIAGIVLFPNIFITALLVLAGSSVLGVFLGIIGSSIAIVKHLKV